MTLPRVLLLTDRSQLSLGRSLVRTVSECVDAGITHVVLRELDLPEPRRAALAEALVDVGATVIAAHHPLPAAAAVHRPETQSCHSRADVERAAAVGVDYVTLGPFAPTPSKPGYGPPLPPEDYAGHPVPAFALGGITPANAAAARAAGAYGVAVMGDVMRSDEPAEVVGALLDVTR